MLFILLMVDCDESESMADNELSSINIILGLYWPKLFNSSRVKSSLTPTGEGGTE